MSRLYITIEIVPRVGQVSNYDTHSGREALDYLIAQNEKQKDASVRVSVEANGEPIVVLAGIAEMQERLATPTMMGAVSNSEGRRRVQFAERQGFNERV